MELVENCCCPEQEHTENCVICGAPLVYGQESREMECAVCHKRKSTNAWCQAGHFVCDDCHSMGSAAVIDYLSHSAERDPVKLFLEVCALPGVHLHGPEHHSIVPCVLLTAYKNCGGEIDLPEYLLEGWKRGRSVPGGACGFLGVCGAAAGAGIYVSLLTDATPLAGPVWDLPQRMTMRCLEAIVAVGGPRCCKRVGRLAMEAASAFTKERFGLDMPVSRPDCDVYRKNRECLGTRCPFFPETKGVS